MVRRVFLIPLVVTFALIATTAFANVYGAVRGVVHDPQHRPIQGAMVTLKAKSSDWAETATTDANGEFQFNAVALGDYSVSVASKGFAQISQDVVVISGSMPVVHFQLQLATVKENVTASAAPAVLPTDSFTPITLVSGQDIERTPGADGTNSMSMITDYVPSTYVTHDMLHMRGGHQISWLLDGIPIINTAIAQNLGPQFDPKDLEYVEVNRGSYGAEFGDRTYGVFNVVPRTGFERNNEAELVLTAGNFYQTDDAAQLRQPHRTLRLLRQRQWQPQQSRPAATSSPGCARCCQRRRRLRKLHLQRQSLQPAPPDDLSSPRLLPNPLRSESQRHRERIDPRQRLQPAIPQHRPARRPNRGRCRRPFHLASHLQFASADHGFALLPLQQRRLRAVIPTTFPSPPRKTAPPPTSEAKPAFAANYKKNDLQVGFLSFYQSDSQLFGAIFNDGSGNLPFTISESPTANLETFYIDDKFKPFSWLMLSAGMRPTRFSEGNFSAGSLEPPISESAIQPRFGATATIPRLHWTFRAFYGHYYQAPPIETVSGPLITQCQPPSCGFLPLHGESDEEHQFGVTIPYRGWVLDADNFQTNVANFLDHNNIGASNIFFPLTVSQALIRGWELTLRSPRIAHRVQLHLAYSNQIAEGSSNITGGLNNVQPSPGLSPLDHDQRNTLNVGGDVTLPWRSYASTNVYYGSGFSNAFPGQPYPGDYLPSHTTFDLSLGKDFGETLHRIAHRVKRNQPPR